MNKFILILLISIISCKSQQKAHTKMATFNFEEFEEYKDKRYYLTDGTGISYYEYTDSYVKEVMPPYPNLFYTYNEYYKNGNPKESGEFLKNNNLRKGIWKYYDENGNLIKEIDYDAPFIKYPWEKVLEFLKQNEIDIKDENLYLWISRGIIDREDIKEDILKGFEGKGVWYLSWVKGIYIYSAIINVENGNIKITKSEFEEGS